MQSGYGNARHAQWGSASQYSSVDPLGWAGAVSDSPSWYGGEGQQWSRAQMRHGGSTSHGAAAAAPGAQWAHAEDMFYSHHDGGVHTGTGREQAMWEQPLREEHPREIRYHSSHQAQPCPADYADPTFLLRHGLPGARGRSMGESSTAPPIPFWPMDNAERMHQARHIADAGVDDPSLLGISDRSYPGQDSRSPYLGMSPTYPYPWHR